MSIPDNLITRYFELITDLSNEQLEKYRLDLDSGSVNPRDYKMALARTVVNEYHGIEAAMKAEQDFVNLFSKKLLPEEIPDFNASEGESIIDLVVRINYAATKGEVRRLIQGGGIRVDSVKIQDVNDAVKYEGKESLVIQVGKHKFARLLRST